MTSNFAKQVAEIEAGLRDPVMFVGDLKPTRDYSDVRDIVRGYWALLDRGEPGEVYNLCSGRPWAIQQMLDFLLWESRSRIGFDRDALARLRPSDVMVLDGDLLAATDRLATLALLPQTAFQRPAQLLDRSQHANNSPIGD